MILLRIFAAWALIDIILGALWIHAGQHRLAENDDAAQNAFLEAWEARHV